MTNRHGHPSRLALALADVSAAMIAATTAYTLRFHAGVIPVVGRADVLPSRYAAALPVVALAALLATAVTGALNHDRSQSRPRVSDAVRAGIAFGAVLAIVALAWWKEFQYSRVAIAIAAATFAPSWLICRVSALAALRAAQRGRFRTPAIVIGADPALATLRGELHRDNSIALDVIAVWSVGDRAATSAQPEHWPGATQLGSIDEVTALVASGTAREILVALPAARAAELAPLLTALEQTSADIRVIPDLGPAVLVNPGLFFVGTLPVLTARETPVYGARAAAKRALDLALAIACTLLLSPLIAACAALVRLTSPGPAIYTQERMGLDGKPFRMLKFRTMREDAEAGTGPQFAVPRDPRVTRVGRFLRRFSLDELPQLWNVLRGEMSLVGPRPERAQFVADFRRAYPGYMFRHSAKPGMTGWAQIHGLRGESSREQRLRYDLEYIERWDLSLDVEILARTLFHVIAGRNAY